MIQRATEIERRRARLLLRGAVQGVGFRPFVYRLAAELGLGGFVLNSSAGATLEVEGGWEAIEAFCRRLRAERPPHCWFEVAERSELPARGDLQFEIRASDRAGPPRAVVLPDLAVCVDCAREVLDPSDRRHRYPFTNCTRCGPRLSILLRLPYDRANTTMRGFSMCPACRREYEDPTDRRFHAQPNACPACGPHLALRGEEGRVRARGDEALAGALSALRRGAAVAVKGLGGFHLMTDAGSGEAVARLRQRKRRPRKPFALLYPSLDEARRDVRIGDEEASLLAGPEAPIVLLDRVAGARVAEDVAPDRAQLGVMLPYTPLHLLLARDFGAPLVATSGNLSEEPIVTGEEEALERLAGIADLFLVHDRPIARPVDDSVARVFGGAPVLLRRSRGYAPATIRIPAPLEVPTLALGGHLKCAVAVASDDTAILGPHIGDLDTEPSARALERAVSDLDALYRIEPRAVIRDAHPDYRTTRFAAELGLPQRAVGHHHAHVLACAAEHGLQGPVLGAAFDGAGYGGDGTVWGGEILRVSGAACERRAHLRTFPLPGGDAAAREPRRAALGALWEIFGPGILRRRDLAPVAAFTEAERALLAGALERGVHAPRTSSAGRLFDAVASLLDLGQRQSYEGEAASALEAAAERAASPASYPIQVVAEGVLDWGPALAAIAEDAASGRPAAAIAAGFHEALAGAVVQAAERAGLPRVVLTGGCFQNRALLRAATRRLGDAGFEVFSHHRVPPGDGGLALGQIAYAAAREQES